MHTHIYTEMPKQWPAKRFSWPAASKNNSIKSGPYTFCLHGPKCPAVIRPAGVTKTVQSIKSKITKLKLQYLVNSVFNLVSTVALKRCSICTYLSLIVIAFN